MIQFKTFLFTIHEKAYLDSGPDPPSKKLLGLFLAFLSVTAALEFVLLSSTDFRVTLLSSGRDAWGLGCFLLFPWTLAFIF